jgi:alkylation response protein AidB-like acyl-CoA dehydrogenase
LLCAALILEEMFALGYANLLPIVTAMGTLAIAEGGSESLRAELLPRLARGELKTCVGATEEDAGFNAFNMRTQATRVAETYRITGRKIYTSGADVADYVLVFARTTSLDELKASGLPRTMGLSLFLMDSKSPGFTRTRLRAHGDTGLNIFITEYDSVEVPAGHRVGEEGRGAAVMFTMANPERILFSAAALGIARHCLEVASAFARERKVFRDTPIGAYQSIQHPLADAKMREEAVRMLVHKAAWVTDNGADPRQSGYLANTAKYLAAEMALKAVDAAIETLGGRGFNEDYDIIHLWEAARLMKTAPISAEMILNSVAESALGLPKSY